MAAEVDMLLIAGDLFDHNRVPDETIAFVQEQLRRLQRPVVILPGNHDCLYTHASMTAMTSMQHATIYR